MIIPKSKKKIRASIKISPDKSITHRMIILASIARSKSTIYNLLYCDDTIRTLSAFQQLNIDFYGNFNKINVHPKRIEYQANIFNAGNSGTTARLLTGLFSSIPGIYTIYGDLSLSKRPMKRVIEPLLLKGASIESENNSFLPLRIEGKKLHSFTYKIPIRSAQVKSSIILSSINSEGKSVIKELSKTRDHTERLILAMGGNLSIKNNTIEIQPSILKGLTYKIPGDLSSAMNFIILCILHDNCKLNIRDVSLNPTRIDSIKILQKMGAHIFVKIKENFIEPVGDIETSTSKLRGVSIDLFKYTNAIDEIPLIAIAALFADGETKIYNASELRMKESDRIKSIVRNFKKLGVKVKEFNDGFSIYGNQQICSAKINTFLDHRIEMAFAILATLTDSIIELPNVSSVNISYPNFYRDLFNLIL